MIVLYLRIVMNRIILDTSFLVNCIRFKIDFFSEIRRICDFNYELCIVDKSVDELKSIIEKGGKDGLFAKIVLQMIKKFNISLINTVESKYVDDLIIENSGKDVIVATQDINLKKRLKENNVQVIFIRQKKYLSF